jgi:tetratricopeptide (TPR) repeat protein
VRRIPLPFLIGGLAVTILMLLVGFLPLFGGPGYEHAVATGLIVPSAAAIATARAPSQSPSESLGHGLVAGLAYALLSLLTAFAHVLRVGICEVSGALLYFALTAGIGSMMGGAWGAAIGELVRVIRMRRDVKRPRLLTTLLCLAGPVAGVLVSLWRFYDSPMVFAYDPFVGFFSGTLYDTVIDPGLALLTYRLGSFATLVALALTASVLVREDDRPFGLVLIARSRAQRVRAFLALVAVLASASLMLFGAKLGHFSSTRSIMADLGAEKHGARCDVVYPSTTKESDANLLVKDCDEEVAAVEERLGTKGPPRIRAIFFRDAEDKKRLMGAAHTYIAKPWREEVYLQLGGYPHPVLGHELAHVIAGSFGHGPFRIAGSAGGLLPNPGLIEGTAVFASPDDEDLTDEQWARAMMDIGILPPMQHVFSLGFLGDASAKSYTLAGAFIDWVGHKWGMDKVRAWYGGAPVEEITGLAWPALDAAYRDYLKSVSLPPEAASFAKAKFQRPGLFGRRCPHAVDAIRHEGDVCRDTQRFEEAIRLYDSALSKDPRDFASKQSRAVTMRRHTDREKGRLELEALAKSEDVPRTYRDRAEEALADSDFIDGKLEPARERYDMLARKSVDEDAARTLEVKRLATEDPAARDAVLALLLGDATHGPDPFVAGIALGRWGDTPLASYLMGRNLLQHGFHEKAAAQLDVAFHQGLPTPRIERETLRQRAIAACAMSDRAALEEAKAVIEGPEDPFAGASGGRRDATLRMIARCLKTSR